MSGLHDPPQGEAKLIEAIDALVGFVRKHHRGDTLSEADKDQLLKLDACVATYTKDCGLEIPAPQADEAAYLHRPPQRPTFGTTKIHYFRRNELSGMAIRSTKGWFERMDQMRILAVVTDECKPARVEPPKIGENRHAIYAEAANERRLEDTHDHMSVERRPITDDEFRRFVELAKNLLQAIQSHASDDEYERHGMRLQEFVVESPLAMRTNATGEGRSEAFANLSPVVAGAMDALVGDIILPARDRELREIKLRKFLTVINREPTPPHSLLYKALGGPPTPMQVAIWNALDLGPAFGRNQIVTRSVSEDVNASDSLAYASGYDAPKTLFEKQESTSLQCRAMKTEDLAHKVAGDDRPRLYYTNRKTKKGGLNEMKEAGCVALKRPIGYYRPDAPPATN